MKIDDLYEIVKTDDPVWGSDQYELRRDLLTRALKAPVEDTEDIDLADTVVRLAHQEFEAYGTSGGNRLDDDDDVELVLRACQRICARCSVTFPTLPFRSFSGFHAYWVKEDMKGSYAARRDYLNGVFQPIEDELFKLVQRTWDEELSEAVSPHAQLGWPSVDREIAELRRRFTVARSSQDHSAVGTACVRILELVGDVALEPARHIPSGMEIPARDKTKNRFEFIINVDLQGKENEVLRKVSRSVVELAHEVKHRSTPSRRDAGIAADAVILLANMIRRIVDSASAPTAQILGGKNI